MTTLSPTPKGDTRQPKTRLEAARIAVYGPGAEGLKRFAKDLKRSPHYVRQMELHGRAWSGCGELASRLLHCDPLLCIWPNWTREPHDPADGTSAAHDPAVNSVDHDPTGQTAHDSTDAGARPRPASKRKQKAKGRGRRQSLPGPHPPTGEFINETEFSHAVSG